MDAIFPDGVSPSVRAITFPLPSSDCKRDCSICAQQFAGADFIDDQYRRNVSDEIARLQAAGRAVSIRNKQRELRDALLQYGDSVQKRWKRLSKAKRAELLLRAVPQLYPHKWPLERASYGLDENAARPKTVAPFLLPWLNVENLKGDPTRLLGLLHNRVFQSIDAWVMYDMAQMKFGWNLGIFGLVDNQKSVIMLGERNYGQLCEWNLEDSHAWRTIGYPRAHLVLEAQDFIFTVMTAIVKLLYDPATSARGSTEWSAMTTKGLKSVGSTELWSVHANQPFSTSPTIGMLDRVKPPLAQLEAAKDHLRLLQTEPAYMYKSIQTRLRKPGGGYFTGESLERIWSIVANDMLVVPAMNIRHLRYVVDECSYLHTIAKENPPAPRRLREAASLLRGLSFSLYELERTDGMSSIVPQASAFGKSYELKLGANGEVGHILRTQNSWLDLFLHDPLHWAVNMLCMDPRDVRVPDVSSLFAFIDDRLAAQATMDEARISQELYDELAIMTVYHDIFNTTSMQRPAPIRNFKALVCLPEHRDRLTWRLSDHALGNPNDGERHDLKTLLRAFYESTPPAGVKNKAWLEQMARSRGLLAKFWQRARKALRRILSHPAYTTEDVDIEIGFMSADQDPAYQKEVEEERRQILERLDAEAKAASARAAAKQERRNQAFRTGADDEARAALAHQKLKSRPVAPKQQEVETFTEAVENLAVNDNAAPPTVAVNANSLRFFRKMFPASSADETKGSVKWHEFVAAMADAGFAATHSGGSAVQFSPVDPAANGSIVFHKPHPDPSIDQIMLQIMGKRMRKWFEWERESFVERQKTASGVQA